MQLGAADAKRSKPGSLRASTVREETVKYKAYSADADGLLFAKWSPSQLIADLTQPTLHAEGHRPRPQVLQLLNIAEHTHQVQSAVGIDQPLFQPYPAEVVFHSYEPFKQYEAILRLRNNDTVARRITVEGLDSEVFHVHRVSASSHAIGSKVAAGMEAVYKVTFTPTCPDSYEQQLVVATERERFVVPLIGVGAAAALDLPDSINMPITAVKKAVKHSILVSNVGRKAGSFQFDTSSSCFNVAPSKASLAPGESLQLSLEFQPVTADLHTGELLVVYENSSRTTFTALTGQGTALDVGLSESCVVFLPTYMGQLSQRSLKLVNNSATTVSYSIRSQPSAEAELAATCSALAAVQRAAGTATNLDACNGMDIATSRWSPSSISKSSHARFQQQAVHAIADTPPVPHTICAAAREQQEHVRPRSSDAYSEDDSFLYDAQLAAARCAKRARRDILADKQLFGNQHFSVFPAAGTISPNTEQVVIVQFSPDCAGDFDGLAWVELQGVVSRLPLQLQGKGLGAQVVFSYDSLDVGEAFVNTEHKYVIEFMNRGKIDAHWSLQPCHTPFGSKFSFSPTEGVLQPGAEQLIHAKLLSDILGQFDETFQVQLQGSRKPATFSIKGSVVGPQFMLDTQSVDFGILSFGFRYTRDVVLTNTGAIPLQYHWHMAEYGPAAKDFTITPAHGTVLPYAKQRIDIEFQPMLVQRFNLNLVMDIPGVESAAVKVPIQAECAVPIITLGAGGDLLQFGQVFLRHPYSQEFTLVNESKLPAKFEVLQQDQQSQALATISANPSSGIIPAKGSLDVSLSLEAERLGRLQLPVFVQITGSRNKPLQVIADARAVGPSLEFAVLPVIPAADKSLSSAASHPGPSCMDDGLKQTADTLAPSVSCKANAGCAQIAGTASVGSANSNAEVGTCADNVSSTGVISDAKGLSKSGRLSTSTAGGRPSVQSSAVLQPQLQWSDTASVTCSKVQVLQEHLVELRLRNPTLVDADIKLFVDQVDSVFKVEPREVVVAAAGESSVFVRMLLDDNAVFKDILHVLVAEGSDLNIPLEATGVGNTVVSDVLSCPQVDFGPQFVGRPWQMEVEVTNKGRKGAMLSWSNMRLSELAKTFSKMAKGTGKKFDPAELPADQLPVFSISPDKVLLGPKETITLIIAGLSHKAGLISEQLQCQYSVSSSTSSSGNKPKPLFDISAVAEVAVPLLDFSKRQIEFTYIHEQCCTPPILTQPLDVRNVTKLPLSFAPKVSAPFSVQPEALSLQPDQSAGFCISFDPDYHHDLMSQTVKQRCLISYLDNPQKDYLDLLGNICCPNLSFDTDTIDFGCVLMDSMQRVPVVISNPGCIPVEYNWSWTAEDEASAEAGSETTAASAKNTTGRTSKLPPSQLFDICPIHGVIQPGHKEQVEFSFHAFPWVKAKAVAACSVVNGPVYQFQLAGESSSIKYDVNPLFFDYGMQPYDRATERELTINNTGKVAFAYSVDLSRVSRPGVVEALPMSGKVAAGDKAKIKLKVKAGIPARLMELVMVSVAHFPPVQVQVLVEGTYPMLMLNLPRIKDDAFLTAVEDAQKSASDQGLAATAASSLDPTLMMTASSYKPAGSGRQNLAVVNSAAIPLGNKSASSVAGQTIVGSGVQVRPGSGAKSQISAISGASAARSKASMASAASAGVMMAKDKLTQLLAALPSDRKLDIEAERLRLVQQLTKGNSTGSRLSNAQQTASLNRSSSSHKATRSRDTVTAVPSALSQQQGEAAKGVPARHLSVPKLPELVSGHYLLDFGSVVKGVNKSKKVKMTNISSQLVQFVVDKQTLEQYGFSMVPEAAVKLAGAPECHSLELTFTVMASKNWVQPGHLELTLPLLLKGGPAVLLTLRALLVVPDIAIDEATLSFGTICCGHCKVHTVRLHNPHEVPAEWSIKKPAVDSPKLKDWSFFTAEPAEGTLEPGASANVKVVFTPLAGRDAPYSLPLPVKVNYNSQQHEILCTGKGYTPKVEFSSKLVECGAILPSFPGQQPAEATVRLTNPGDYPIEVVCIDMDKQYVEDQEMLRSLDIYGDTGVALLRPLAAGERPWPELLQAAALVKQAQNAAAQQLAAAQQTLAGLQSVSADNQASSTMCETAREEAVGAAASSTIATALVPDANQTEGVGDLVMCKDAAAQHSSKTIVVVYGAPMAGAPSQAAKLSSRYKVPCVDIDTLLKEASSLINTVAAAPVGDSIPEEEEVQTGVPQLEPNLCEMISKLLDPASGTAALIAAELSKTQQTLSATQSAANSRASTPPQAAQLLQPGRLSVTEVVYVAVKAISIALNQPQYDAGFVINGVYSEFLPHAALAARCLLQAIGLVDKALQPTELQRDTMGRSASGSGTATGGGKGKDKSSGAAVMKSRPSSSSKAGARGLMAPEPLHLMLDISRQDVWEGLQQVHFVGLNLAKEEAAQRHSAALAAAAEGLEAPGADLVAVTASLGVQQQADLQHHSEQGTVTQGSVATTTLDASWEAYEQTSTALLAVVGAAGQTMHPIKHRVVNAGVDEQQLAADVVGIRFKAGEVCTELPPVEADKMLVPPPYELRVLAQPPRLPKRPPLTKFTVWTLPNQAAEGCAASGVPDGSIDFNGAATGPAESVSRPLSAASALSSKPLESAALAEEGKKGPASKAIAKGRSTVVKAPAVPVETTVEEQEKTERGLTAASRWILQPHSSIELLVQFSSDTVGKFTEVLGFGVLCGEHDHKVILTGACDYPRISTDARNLYYKTAKSRPPTPQVKQQYILPTSVFEFGPVLSGNQKPMNPDAAHSDHTARFRITNNGLFSVHADFWLKSEGSSVDPTAPAPAAVVAPVPEDKKKKPTDSKASAGAKPVAKPAPAVQPVFQLESSSMDLALDETQELTIHAYPASEGLFEDVIMCRLRDNPDVLEFPISVIGARPSVAIKLSAAATAQADSRASGPRRQPDVAPPKPNSKTSAGAKALQKAELTVQFDRLLLGKKDSHTFIISNTGVLPFKWHLAGAAQLPPEFRVYPLAGDLSARRDVKVTVEFTALKKMELAELVTLEVLDLQEAAGVSRSVPIAIKGEAHDIHVDMKFPQDNFMGVDFGPLRVIDDCVKNIVMRNTEKYEVRFEYAVRSDEVKRLVTIAPESGMLLPNKETVITMHWNKDHQLRQEISFNGNTDIMLLLIDPSKAIKEQQLPIKLSARAQFSHYAITPARGMHFGPTTYNTLSKPRTFEVVNLGEFSFTLRISDMHKKQSPLPLTWPKSDDRPKSPGARPMTGRQQNGLNSSIPPVPDAPPGALQLGQFTLDPAEAVVKPGCRQEVSVVFRALGNSNWSAVASLDVSERDFADQPAGIPYELEGESCIPGIDTQNVGAIFEEHVVLSHLDPFKPVNLSYGLRDKVFNFGAILAQLPEVNDALPAGNDTAGAGPGRKGVPGKSPGRIVRTSTTGSLAAAPSGTLPSLLAGCLLDEPGAVKANLKFTNPVKVPCTVNFIIKPRGGHHTGVRFPIEVYPSSIVIPPHEYRHVTLAFCPTAIQQYSATFEAVVAGGVADPVTAGFVFEVRGEGTLPSLSFQEPSAIDSAGRPVLKFGKLSTGRSNQLIMNVRNHGVLPASARLEMETHPAFTLLEGTQVLTLESKKAATFTVAFHPPDVGVYHHELQLRVKQNPFEQYKVAMTGECYKEDLMFAGLPDDSTAALTLPDVLLLPMPATPTSSTRAGSRVPQPDGAVSNTGPPPASQLSPVSNSSYTFSLVNESDSKHYRFKWPEHPQLKFLPSVGHIHAGCAKNITVTFVTSAPVKLDGQDIKLPINQITYKGEPIEWDDVLAATIVASGARASSATRVASGLPGSGPKPGAEPLVDMVAKTQKDLVLKVYATADSPRYECTAPTPSIVFRPTMMFQTRSFTFSITNNALIALQYFWHILDKQGQLDTSGVYEIAPDSGTISGGASQEFTLRFSPHEVEDVTRQLVAHLPLLKQLAESSQSAAAALSAITSINRSITGKVLRPWCHFELSESDYLLSGRRNPELPGPSGMVEPLDPATKVLEFNSLGVRVRNTTQFFTLNPTNISYDFVWAPVLSQAVAALGGPPPPSAFTCLTRKGTISGGRKFEMVFEYTPTTDVLCESFWTFSIPSQGITVPFLLVGQVAEPRVSLDRPAINFGQVQLGIRGKIMFYMINDEHLPFTFTIDKGSYDASSALLAASGGKAALDITPASGTVGPNSKVELCAVFAPQAERSINYNVMIRVRNKPTPIVLNVKGEGYALQPAMLLELPDDSNLELSPAGINAVDFGKVVINDKVIRSFSLVNSGRVNFDFVWELGSTSTLAVKPQAGSVPKGERRVVELSYAPTSEDRLEDHLGTCQIINGPKYKMSLRGSGYTPKLNFSFLSHMFGPCHVWQHGMTPASVVLNVLNQDTQPVSFDVLFDNTDNWQVQSNPCALLPGQSQEIGIVFKPTAAEVYNTVVPVRVNGLFNINIKLEGEGVPLRVELAKPEQLQRGLTFGAVPCGSSCSRTLSLINRGKATAFVSLGPSLEMLQRLGVELMPAEGVSLKPREMMELNFWYRPKQRTRPFKEQLHAEVAGVHQVLTTIAGACTGLSVLLASDSIPFGSVVLGSRTTKRVQLSNAGDVGCRFAWDTKQVGQHFSIHPAEGFLAPGQDVKLEVSFHPTSVNSDIRVERLHCKLSSSVSAADSSRSASPALGAAADIGSGSGLSSDLLLTLTGACIMSEAVGEPVQFRCTVRGNSSQTLQLQNNSSTNWQLRPVVQNEFWSGAEFLQVPAGATSEYKLVYKPLTMTSEGAPHEGSVFFPIPDGSGLLYRLHGHADQPTPEAVLELSLPAKTKHTQMLKVTNWLHKPQRFKVITELLVGEASTRLEGASAVDVPALCDREYKLGVYSYTQGLMHARITFKNEATGEYTFYEIKLSSSAPAPVGTLTMECPVRCVTSNQISIANPLPVPITMKSSVTSRQISLHPDPAVLAPNSTSTLEVRYRPLLVGSSDAALRLESRELGLYEWKLKLKGAPTNPERSLAFSAPLGTRDTQVFRFTHWLPEKVDYKCSFKNSSKENTIGANVISPGGFDAPVVITAPPSGPHGVEVECVVGFEPSAVGEAVRDVLLVSSSAAGAYEVPLMGQCVPPKPQGPVDLSKGSAVVQFRNVFGVDAEFFYSVDNPAFVLVKSSEKLSAKKPVSISISFKPDASSKVAADRAVSAGKEKSDASVAVQFSRAGKLTISCPKQTSTQWVYYLQA